MEQERDTYWDVIKGIGICSIVIGHASSLSHDFVYTYHLAIFMFVTGYLYNCKKALQNPWQYLGQKAGSNWIKYVSYSICILFIYLFVQRWGYIDGKVYTSHELAYEIVNIIFLGGGIPLQGALWFVPMMLLSTTIFCGLIYWTERLKTGKLCKFNSLFLGGSACIIGLLGIWITDRNTDLKYFLNISMLFIPVVLSGYLVKINIPHFKKYIHGWIGVFAAACIFVFAYIFNWDINLALNITTGIKFYIISAIGIYMVLALGKYLNQKFITKRIFSLMGMYSFEIMAFHFSVFKLMDMLYGKMGGASDERLPWFPTALVYPDIIYIIAGCIFSIVIGIGIQQMWKKIENAIFN